MNIQKYSLRHLEALPTLHQGQADDCKIDTGLQRVWLSRMTIEDGMEYNNQVTEESYVDNCWLVTRMYQAI